MKSLLALALIVLLAGCNTIAGAGKDIKAAGSKIEKTAEKNKSAPVSP